MTNTVDLMVEGKTPALLKYIPEGESPKMFLDLVKAHVMGVDQRGNARPSEDLLLFLYTAKRVGLDPLAKQIYAVYRWDSRVGAEKMAIQIGIDGMRAIAERTGKYAGQSDATFDDEKLSHPNSASVTVYKMIAGKKVETTATARWGEYCPLKKDGTPMGMWQKMPFLMLGKCAESLALRKAFPVELGGLYTPEEMQQADKLELPEPEVIKAKKKAKKK
jgi:phage recombination protein Bet